jgi:hypothetical protein
VLGGTCATGAKAGSGAPAVAGGGKKVGDGRALADAEGVRDGFGVGLRDGLDELGVGVAVGLADGVGVGVGLAVGVADGVGDAVALGVTVGESDGDGVAEDAVPGDGVVEGEVAEDGAVEDWAAEVVAVDEPGTGVAPPGRMTATVEILAAGPGWTLACTPPVLARRTTAVPAAGQQARVAAVQAVKVPMTVSALRPAPADIRPPCLDYPDIQCEQYSKPDISYPESLRCPSRRHAIVVKVPRAQRGVATDDGRS